MTCIDAPRKSNVHHYSRRTPGGTTGGPADDGGSCPHRDGDCLRRPRYQSSLHSAGGRANFRRWLVRIGGAGIAFADLLAADHHHFDQVLRVRDARRQPRRGRHSRADVTHACELARTRPGARHHGPVRRGLDLWRRHHHAGDFGAERARGSQSGDRGLQAACHADGGDGPARFILGADRGTARIGKAFGPVMLVWFATIAVLGVGGILHRPDVLAAVNPAHALGFLLENPRVGFLVLGPAFLAITGGEPLYADMGHVGRNPIRTVWYCVVLPALLLNYAGQTSLYLDDPALAGNPFFRLVPQWSSPARR